MYEKVNRILKKHVVHIVLSFIFGISFCCMVLVIAAISLAGKADSRFEVVNEKIYAQVMQYKEDFFCT